MRLAHFRVRTRELAVAVVALLVWGAMMGTRSYDLLQDCEGIQRTRQRGWRGKRRQGSRVGGIW